MNVGRFTGDGHVDQYPNDEMCCGAGAEQRHRRPGDGSRCYGGDGRMGRFEDVR
jgi:hypothetical protein